MEKYGRARQATVDNIRRITCCVPKAKNTHSEYVIIIAVPLQNVCTNAPQCYVYTKLPVLFLSSLHRVVLHFQSTARCHCSVSYAHMYSVTDFHRIPIRLIALCAIHLYRIPPQSVKRCGKYGWKFTALRRSSRISRKERIRNVTVRQQIGLEETIIKKKWTEPAYMVRSCSENGARKITRNIIEVDSKKKKWWTSEGEVKRQISPLEQATKAQRGSRSIAPLFL